MFLVVQYAEEDGIDDDAKKKMAAPEDDNQIKEDIAYNEPSACDALV